MVLDSLGVMRSSSALAFHRAVAPFRAPFSKTWKLCRFKKSPSPTKLELLPPELIGEITQYLDPICIASLSLSCPRLLITIGTSAIYNARYSDSRATRLAFWKLLDSRYPWTLLCPLCEQRFPFPGLVNKKFSHNHFLPNGYYPYNESIKYGGKFYPALPIDHTASLTWVHAQEMIRENRYYNKSTRKPYLLHRLPPLGQQTWRTKVKALTPRLAPTAHKLDTEHQDTPRYKVINRHLLLRHARTFRYDVSTSSNDIVALVRKKLPDPHVLRALELMVYEPRFSPHHRYYCYLGGESRLEVYLECECCVTEVLLAERCIRYKDEEGQQRVRCRLSVACWVDLGDDRRALAWEWQEAARCRTGGGFEVRDVEGVEWVREFGTRGRTVRERFEKPKEGARREEDVGLREPPEEEWYEDEVESIEEEEDE
ncbi:hypothetical protein K402DRAFT_397464 [Aulographum hederae CBS 113979]|uniref:F-box domain-containing protein n=1 Tax=Aulographum hederae CBS 113979 TaxID=1176131 RepID=A0A6G1GP74_9PEZI|nr:hypothetical protein K402DRAFT_397464 [Aulographum hederae CBS 113979]